MREIVLECAQEEADALSDALLDAGALSVSLEDADIDTDDEQAIYGEPGEDVAAAWRRNLVIALLADDAEPDALVTQAAQACGRPAPHWRLRDVPDADWVRRTQAQFGPQRIGDRLWVVPTWHDGDAAVQQALAAAGPSARRLVLDPGLAFGTGSHPTTRLCLGWLESRLPQGATVLDYGCGSGILAIAARLLGAGEVWAVDIDPQAVTATGDNAQANGVTVRAALPDGLPAGTYDVVVANILSNPLRVLAPMLAQRVAPGGELVLSGILARQADDLIAHYASWLPMSVWQADEDWVCLHGRRPG